MIETSSNYFVSLIHSSSIVNFKLIARKLPYELQIKKKSMTLAAQIGSANNNSMHKKERSIETHWHERISLPFFHGWTFQYSVAASRQTKKKCSWGMIKRFHRLNMPNHSKTPIRTHIPILLLLNFFIFLNINFNDMHIDFP